MRCSAAGPRPATPATVEDIAAAVKWSVQAECVLKSGTGPRVRAPGTRYWGARAVDSPYEGGNAAHPRARPASLRHQSTAYGLASGRRVITAACQGLEEGREARYPVEAAVAGVKWLRYTEWLAGGAAL